jgi:uncharacterized protein YpmB
MEEECPKKQRKNFEPMLLIIFMILVLIIMIVRVFSMGKKQSQKIPFEELKTTAIATAVTYMEEKYGDEVIYSDVHEGRTSIVLGERKWTVTFADEDGQTYDVMVRYDSDNNCMYIEWDYYYSYYIEDRMTKWMGCS